MTALLALIPGPIKTALICALAAFVLVSGSYLYGKREGRRKIAIKRLQSDIKAERERIDSDAKVQNLSDYDFCFSLFVLAGCGSRGASSCAGFRKANLNAAATVAVIQLDRPGAERIEGNDQNGKRQGCWK